MHCILWMHEVYTLKSGKAECRRWTSVLSSAQKEKNEASEHRACVLSVPNFQSPAKARSQSESAENAVASSNSNSQALHSVTRHGDKHFPTSSLLQHAST